MPGFREWTWVEAVEHTTNSSALSQGFELSRVRAVAQWGPAQCPLSHLEGRAELRFRNPDDATLFRGFIDRQAEPGSPFPEEYVVDRPIRGSSRRRSRLRLALWTTLPAMFALNWVLGLLGLKSAVFDKLLLSSVWGLILFYTVRQMWVATRRPRFIEPAPSRRWKPGNIVIAALAGLVILAYFMGSSTETVSPGSPAILTIRSVSKMTATPAQNIRIRGSGFGTHAPYFNQNTPYLSIEDRTARWATGPNFAAVTIGVASWTDTEIIITRFSGAYGSRSTLQLHTGDSVVIKVWNPQTGAGPATRAVTVQR
jgi:hypothetical protein